MTTEGAVLLASRVPSSAIKSIGATVDAPYYPGEGHGFVKHESQIDALQRTVDWFEKYLKPGRTQ